MKQIDNEISELKSAIEYVSIQFPRILGEIQISVNEFINNPDKNHPYEKTMNEISAYADELKRLVATERQNRFMLETLEDIKDEDY